MHDCHQSAMLLRLDGVEFEICAGSLFFFSFASVIIEVAARATHVTCLRFTDGAGVRMMIRYQGGGNENLDELNHRNRRATSASIRRSPLQHCRLVLKPCFGNSGMSYHR